MMIQTERLRAERALDGTTSGASHEWPSVAGRIRDARLKSGLDQSDIAGRLGCSVASYGDLEAYDDEAFTVPSLRDFVRLAEIVSVEPSVLLLGAEAHGIQRTFTFTDIAERVARRVTDSGVTVAELGDQIGFDVQPLLNSSEALWDYDVEALYRICKTVGIDWVAALPESPTP